MFKNSMTSMTWLFITIAAICMTGIICESRNYTDREKTKQIQMQLNIEMVKAGITNFPANKY